MRVCNGVGVHMRLTGLSRSRKNLPGESVVNSLPSVGRSHGTGVVSGIRGRLSNVAFGCRISYKNSGMIGTSRKDDAKTKQKKHSSDEQKICYIVLLLGTKINWQIHWHAYAVH